MGESMFAQFLCFFLWNTDGSIKLENRRNGQTDNPLIAMRKEHKGPCEHQNDCPKICWRRNRRIAMLCARAGVLICATANKTAPIV